MSTALSLQLKWDHLFTTMFIHRCFLLKPYYPMEWSEYSLIPSMAGGQWLPHCTVGQISHFLWNGCIGCIYFVKILANSAPTRAGWPPQTSVSPWAALTTTALHIKYFLSKLQKAAVDSKASDLRSPIPPIPHCRQLFIARLETQAVTLDLQIFCLWGCGARLPSCYLVQQILCNRILELN